MPNLQIDETIENTAFLRNCMNMHSIHRRKRPRKLHQYAPDRHSKASHHKPRNFFICRHNADFVWDNGIISSSHHSASWRSITGTQPEQHPTQRGGDYRGGIYIAK
nr:MAG TPA: hypothetical protein [Caudoviricetes sp.]